MALGLSPLPPTSPINWKPLPLVVGNGPVAPFGTGNTVPPSLTMKPGVLLAASLPIVLTTVLRVN